MQEIWRWVLVLLGLFGVFMAGRLFALRTGGKRVIGTLLMILGLCILMFGVLYGNFSAP